MADEVEQTPTEVAQSRQDFLSNPPEILDPSEAPPVDEAAQAAAEEAEAFEELSQSSAPEGATTPTPAPAPTPTADPYRDFGGEEQVRLAWQVQEALRTEQGVRALVANGLQALGYDPAQITAALQSEGLQQALPNQPEAPAAAADQLAGLDDDDVVDVKTVRAYAQTVAEQAAQKAVAEALGQVQPQVQSVQEAILEQQQAQLRSYTDTALIEVLGQPPADEEERKVFASNVDATVARASVYYNPQLANDANHVRSCIAQAHADLEAEAEQRVKAYIAGKKRARDAQPVNVGGGAGAEGPLAEPRNMTEARDQARKSGFFQ